jgi:hypothetical protein
LTVRAVPDGDEYDKDITLFVMQLIMAKVINGSFGKAFLHKEWVYDAIKYERRKTS